MPALLGMLSGAALVAVLGPLRPGSWPLLVAAVLFSFPAWRRS